MSRTRTRWRLSLTATALLAASFLVPAPVNAAAEGTTAEDVTAEDTTDYAITVDPRTAGARIDDTMYGVFFEDINRAADGGLYAELVQNRSFEYSKADNGSYTSLTSWATTGAAKTADDDGRLNARNRTYLTLDGGSSVTNSGYNTGISVEKGKVYDFSVWARAEEGRPSRSPSRTPTANSPRPGASPPAEAGRSTRHASPRPVPAPPAGSPWPPAAPSRST